MGTPNTHLARTVELLGEELADLAPDLYRDVGASTAGEARRIAGELDALSDRLYVLASGEVA